VNWCGWLKGNIFSKCQFHTPTSSFNMLDGLGGSGEVGVGVTYWNDRRKSSHKLSLASGGLCTGTTMGKREICKTRTWRLREIYVYISVLYEYCDGALSVVRSVCDIGLHDPAGFSIMTVSDLKTSV